MAVKIYSDAGSNLFHSLLKLKGLEVNVLAMTLDVAGKSYHLYDDDIDVAKFSKSFYQDMRNGCKVKTSLINPSMFLDAFQKEVDAGNEVVCFTISSGISGTFQSACIAASEINQEKGHEVVHVVDSKTAGFGEGIMAMDAAKLVKKGCSFEEVVKASEERVLKVRSEFMVDDAKYLAATGRVSAFVAKIASMLNIKVLLKGSTFGKIEMSGKVHGKIMAIKSMASTLLAHIKDFTQTVYISHCDDEESANKLKKLLLAGGVQNVEVYYYDLVTGSHVGPGTIAVFYEGENRE